MTNVPAWPLQWPQYVKRAPYRRSARFHKRGDSGGLKLLSVNDARQRLQGELDRLGAGNTVLSTNCELRLDGAPRSNQEPADPGIAVYFTLKCKQMCMPCDRWDRVADNIAAVAGHIDAIRSIERYGVQSVEEAFSGFKLLAAPPHWTAILNLRSDASLADAETAWKELMKRDQSLGHERMVELNSAISRAREELAA